MHLESLLSKHLQEMEDWAAGRKSWTNEPYSPEQVAVLDAQEVIKHAACVQAYAACIHAAEDDA